MSEDTREVLSRAARQLIALEQLLGCDFLTAGGPQFEAASLPAAGPVAAASAAPGAAMSRQEKAAALAAMDADEVSGCTKCGLCQGRTKTVFGEGDPDADLVFVGEAPGHDEDLSGRPFVGRAGELLTKMIAAMGLSRDEVFICNTVKCRPPNNRNPMPDETSACWPYLIRQLQIIAPKVVVTMGNPATKALLRTDEGITRLRGTWQRLPAHAEGLEGIPVMPTFHPAYVLRQYTPENRRKVWSDLQQVMQLLGLETPGG